MIWKYFVIVVCLLGFVLPTMGQEKVNAKGYKRLVGPQRSLMYAHAKQQHGQRLAMKAMFQTLPAAFDCRAQGWVLPIGDQGQCGSCYLYSTIYGTLSQAFVKAGYGKSDGSLVMAVQFGMDCHDFGGCNGGNGTEVIDWVVKNGWPAEKWVDIDGVAHADYPAYEARSRACRTPAGAKMWKPATWGFATSDQSDRPSTVDEKKTAMFNYGTLNCSLDAGGQFGNGVGTITSLGSSIDHEIEMVAWDDAHDNGDGTKGAFLLKNQWTKDWGNAGYRWVTYKASANIVDTFWVSVTPLPPPPGPPVPPVPPIPVPPGPAGGTITFDTDMPKGVYRIVPADAEVISADMTIRDLTDALDRIRKKGGKACCLPLAPTLETRIESIERTNAAIVTVLEKLQKKLEEKK